MCADEIISAPCSAINGSTANFLPLRNTIRVIYIRLRSRKFLVNEFFHRYLSVKWINRFDFWIRSYLRITRFRDRYDRYVAILRIVCSVSIFLPFSFFFILSRWLSIFFLYRICESTYRNPQPRIFSQIRIWFFYIIILIKIDRHGIYICFVLSIIGKERWRNSSWGKKNKDCNWDKFIRGQNYRELSRSYPCSRVTPARFPIDLMPSVFQRNSVTLQILFSTANCPQVLVETVNRYAMLMKFVYSRR